MKNSIEIGLYENGYRTSDINCIDLPLAACAGHYSRNYYFMYCLCYCHTLNWISMKYMTGEGWFPVRNLILEFMGLHMQSIEVDSPDLLMDKVTEGIGKGYPVFLVVKYGSLFYSRYFKWGTYDHGIIVSDYDSERNVVGIRDREVVRDYIDSGIFQSDIMHRIQIEYRHLQDIYKYSNILFREESSTHTSKIYYVKPAFDSWEPLSVQNILQAVLQGGTEPFSSQFEKYILSFNANVARRGIGKAELESTRRIYYRSFMVFRDVLQRLILSEMPDGRRFESLMEEFNVFLKGRLHILDLLQLNAVRKQMLDITEILKLTKHDADQFSMIRGMLVEQIKKSNGSLEMRNEK